jgi:hypothetical protein
MDEYDEIESTCSSEVRGYDEILYNNCWSTSIPEDMDACIERIVL